MKVVGVVQARMNSSRLPGKTMALIEGRPMAWHIVDRLRYAKTLKNVVLAIPDGIDDAPLKKMAQKEGIPLYAGSEFNVLDRILQTGVKFQADAIIRIPGDCPLVDPAIVDLIVWTYLGVDKLDYVSNTRPRTHPAGLSAELFPMATLQRLQQEIKDPVFYEWFPVYLWEHEQEFRTQNIEHDEDLSRLRWTVDYKEDLTFVRLIFQCLRHKEAFGLFDILALLEERPEIANINAMHKVGYFHGFPYRKN